MSDGKHALKSDVKLNQRASFKFIDAPPNIVVDGWWRAGYTARGFRMTPQEIYARACLPNAKTARARWYVRFQKTRSPAERARFAEVLVELDARLEVLLAHETSALLKTMPEHT